MEQAFKGKATSLKTTLVIMKNIDTNLNVSRSVVAVEDCKDLKKGERYFIRRMDVEPFKTNLWIENKPYNSVLFSEVEDSPLMKALGRVKVGNTPRIICQLTRPLDLKLELGNYCFPAVVDDDMLSSMPLEGTITIGRDEACDVTQATIRLNGEEVKMNFSSAVSRMHAVIYREHESSWVIFDVSTFGTKIVI